jgi:predicted membrane-bound spermidine synthase
MKTMSSIAARQRILLLVVVFISGMTSLAVELSASRLLAPYFGTSLFIWANLIGMELIYLTIGYYVGGRMADRSPNPVRLYTIVTIAGFLIGLVPALAPPILGLSLRGFTNLDFGAFYGSLMGTILLFAVPITLLGMVTPFAIRLEITKLDRAGNTAGLIYALSTVGSIIGTFTPVFVFIPSFGTRITFEIFAVCLFLGGISGLWMAGARQRVARVGGPLSIILLISIIIANSPHIIKPAYQGNLITEAESLYNYIQVVKADQTYELILNEGQAVHSVYTPGQITTGGIWDLFLMGPLFNNPPYNIHELKSAAIVGLGGGTVAKIITNTYGPIPIDGVEIDPEIVRMGRTYFAMNEPNLNVIVDDGRYYLERTQKRYDFIAVDAYQQPYIPFQLTTKEFFQLAREHLTSQGTLCLNSGRTATDYRLVDALATTIHAVFKQVYVIDSLTNTNSMICATNDNTTQIGNLSINMDALTQPDLHDIALQATAVDAHLRIGKTTGAPFTDDHAPVETIINQIILNFVRDDGK